MALSFSFRHAIPPTPCAGKDAQSNKEGKERRGPSFAVLALLPRYVFIVASPFVSASQFMTWEGATKDPLLVAAVTVAASLKAAAVFLLLQCQMNSFINVPPTKGVDNVIEGR